MNQKNNAKVVFVSFSLCTLMLVGNSLLAQNPPPPPPPAPAATGDTQNPPPPPPPPPTAAPAAGQGSATGDQRAEISSDLVAGNQAIGSLDLATAQSFYEQAFAKCDTYDVKGQLLARVYMALGSLYSGYLQQVPQGAEFFKMGLQIDANAAPDRAIVNQQVTGTLNMVKANLGIAVDKPETATDQPPPRQPGPGGDFWIMKHEKVTAAKRMTPMGIYIETNPMVAVKGARFGFRLPSDRDFQVVTMKKNGSMFGMIVGCESLALLDPRSLFYYIEVIGGDNSIIGKVGSREEPVEIQLFEDANFRGKQPVLPGMAVENKCNPDENTPCPPWDPHCKDTSCLTDEDCIGGQICQAEYCVSEDDGARKGSIGIVISAGVGMGVGIASGKEDGIGCNPYSDETCVDSIDLASGFSPSWMSTRLHVGYYILDNLLIGAFARFQHLNGDKMQIAGLMVNENTQGRYSPDPDDPEEEVEYDKVFGPMWGPTVAFFLYGDNKWFGPGQVFDNDGKLAAKPGFRMYTRFEFDVYGAMYHEVTVSKKVHIEGQPPESMETKSEKRQKVSGMNGIGLGVGVLYGIHKYVDIGAEFMYDVMFPTVSQNFDLQLELQFHF